MAVYFVYRCDEAGQPTSLYRKRFEDASVIDWFRTIWTPIADDDKASEHADALLGIHVYSFYDVFRAAAENETPPKTIKDVCSALSWCYHSDIRYEKHCVQLLTDDDETDMTYYIFDDEFASQNPKLVNYLLHDGPLPDGAGEPGWKPSDKKLNKRKPLFRGEGEGRIYIIPEIRGDSSMYDDMDSDNLALIEGLRVSELARQLMSQAPDVMGEEWWYYHLKQLRQVLLSDELTQDAHERAFVQTLQSDPNDEATWRAYSDWLMDHGGPCASAQLLRLALSRLKTTYGDPNRSVVHVGEHVVQASIFSGGEGYDNLILFDDLWGSAHPDLANTLIRHCSRWDVLTTGKSKLYE